MRKTRKAAAVLTTVAMAAVSAAPVMADEITDLYDYELQSSEIETWNILQSQQSTELNVLTNLYDGLVEADEYGKLVPAIAESWETEDNGITWTFHLREGVKWVDQNGNEKGEVTAQDFLTGLEWILNFHKNDAANTEAKWEAGKSVNGTFTVKGSWMTFSLDISGNRIILNLPYEQKVYVNKI